MLIDRVEQLARVFLWLAIGSACIVLPIAYFGHRSAEADLKAAADKAHAAAEKAQEQIRIAEKAAEEQRLSLGSMGMYMTALTPSTAAASLWITNVSPRKGAVCAVGVATNRTTHRTAKSIASCLNVAAYASTVRMSFMFAGSELNDVCPSQNACEVNFEEAPAASKD
jgi:hypothetical protein